MNVKPNKMMIKRSLLIMIITVLCISVVSTASLVNIMIINGEKYQGLASEQQLYDNLVSAPRGDILDRNMKTLATSSTAWTVYITPNGLKNLEEDEAEEVIRQTTETVFEPFGNVSGTLSSLKYPVEGEIRMALPQVNSLVSDITSPTCVR
mgnify:CR=1 FL=1